jgi:MYXO-CTERM domain-containing protein
LSCDTCHGGGEALTLELSGLPEAGWAPGATYMLDVAWSPSIEHAAILAELTDASGLAVGELSLPPQELLTDEEKCASGTRAAAAFEPDGDRMVMAIGDCGAHRLRIQWRAPDSAEVGTVSLHLASVRGDGEGDVDGDGPSLEVHPIEPYDPLRPLGASAEGCRVGEPDISLFGLGLLLVFGLLGYRRRERSTTSVAVAAVVALFCATGCARVQPWERGRLAQPDMLIDIGGDLLVGSQHAVEYREGSAGAVGGAGGGCGCN